MIFSGAMCSRGVTGLDDLHSATNEFLGHFVDVVYESKGDGKFTLLPILYFLNFKSLFILVFSML